MREITEIYKEIDASFEEALETFGEKELVVQFAQKFAEEPSYGELVKALDAKAYDEAFTYVHGMKSLTGSLGFTDLYDKVCALTELLRPGYEERRIPNDIKEAAGKLETAYVKVVDALK